MPLDELYVEWLYRQVGFPDVRNLSQSYWKLMQLLYEKEFTWDIIEKDENRAHDGKDLRREFLDETCIRPDKGWLDFGCSMLELMVALSRKLAFQSDAPASDWFWILIDNLGLTECTNAVEIDEQIVNHILDKVILRDYAVNGAGGLFPLQSHGSRDQDQRNVELWYQAEAYLLERL